MITSLLRVPRPSWRLMLIVRRNFLVWRKLIWPSIAGLLLDPAIALFGIGLGIGSMVGTVDGMSYIIFVASGMAAYSVTMTASFEGLFSAYSRMQVQKTWDAILCAPMMLDDVFLGELVWAATKATISAAAMLLVVTILGYVPWLGALLALPCILLGGLAIAAFALCCNAKAGNFDFFSYYFSLFLTPMTMLSGLFFPREILPQPLYLISEWLPMTQLLFLIRPLALGQWPEQFIGPVVYLVMMVVIFTCLAYQMTYRRMVP